MKSIKLPTQNTFSLSFTPEELMSREKVRMPDGRMAIKIGTTDINPNHPDLVQARENGSQVIWATINIELKLQDIITKYLFGIGLGLNEHRDFFINEIMTSIHILFSFKKKLALKIIKQKALISNKKYSTLEKQLAQVMKYRNAFAHGILSIENNKDCLLEFFSGQKQEIMLNDSFWDKLTTIFKTVNESLNEATKKLSNINLKRYQE